MSFFLLYESQALSRTAEHFAVDAADKGLNEGRRIQLGKYELVLFQDQNQSKPAFFLQPNGDFIAALGSLLYDGEPAPNCLPALLAEFSPETFAWEGLLGTHVLLIKKDGALHVCGDGLGANGIFTDADHTVWSNSFLALLELIKPKTFDIQACYEYVTNGAIFGDRSLVEGVSRLPADSLLILKDQVPEVRQRPSPISTRPLDHLRTLDAIADYHVKQLEQVFEPLARNYADRIRLSFSGGFDSRLMLANLIKFGARPSLFVYGDKHDEDVRIAQRISKGEGLPLECIDKSTIPAPGLDEFVGETEKNLFAFDGWKVETPLFDFGADREDRTGRHHDGQIPLNGSLGEIYRNFFYIPDGPSSTGAVVSTFYSRYDRKAFTERFSEDAYRAAMQAAMREAIGTESDRLMRSQVEEIYPKFRGRFWTGRDAQINQRFGPMFFPYLEPAAISDTAKIPIRFKDLGYLQGRMIGQINGRLANYPSDYGFALNGKRPLKYRLKTYLGTKRPAALRKLSFRMTHREAQPHSGALAPEYLTQVIDLEFPIMRTLFHIGQVNSSTQYGLIATLEYLGQRYNLQVPAA